MKGAALAALGLALVSPPARAQEPMTLAPGLPVRLKTKASGGTLTGTIQSSDAAVLDVITAGRVTRVRRDDVTRLEVGVGRGNYRLAGGIVGGLAGFGVGAASIGGEPSCPPTEICDEWAIFTPIILGALGGAAGWGLGSLIRPQRWTDIPLDRVRVHAGPISGRGVGVRVSFAF